MSWDSTSAEVSFLVDIEQFPKHNFTIFPNPASEQITFRNDDNQRITFILRNSQGAVIYISEVNSQSSYSHGIADYSPGLYYVNVISDSFVSVNKLIIK